MSAGFQVGIDWGTHSSKICVADPKGDYIAAPLLSSDLLYRDEHLVFSPKGKLNPEDLVRGLKRDLIEHSLSVVFWGRDDRPNSGTSLGEAVAFSLMNLLAESKRQLAKAHPTASFLEAELGFSFPNWLAEDTRKATIAAESFCEAVGVAVHVVASRPIEGLPAPGKAFSIKTLKEWTADARVATQHNQGQHLTIGDVNTTVFRSGTLEWRFIVESGAAGLPYLRAMRPENRPGIPGLAKLLVVDVGAGSTDVGYMLRTNNIKTGDPTFHYFRPASTFAEAGNALTEELVKYHRAQNRPITWAEAEAQKVSQTAWHKLSFVQLWIRHICDHVAQYVVGVPDQRWLPLPVKVHLVVTGGSSLVPGLKDQLRQAVVGALGDRRFDRQTCEAVQVADRYRPRFNLDIEAEIARRAVCFGAADPDKPGFRYMPKMDPPPRGRLRLEGAPWT
jgi:hypothetical protein